jgi:hypothetical protein
MSVQATSLDAFDGLRPTLNARQMTVLRALEGFIGSEGYAPTAYELFEVMQRQNLARDLNDVRPRLTELKDQGRVVNPEEKRVCAVTRKRAFAWRLIESPRLF